MVTWGNPQHGSDSSKIKDQLEHVVEIYAADSAFACLRNDRSVVTWGIAGGGGDSSKVRQDFL